MTAGAVTFDIADISPCEVLLGPQHSGLCSQCLTRPWAQGAASEGMWVPDPVSSQGDDETRAPVANSQLWRRQESHLFPQHTLAGPGKGWDMWNCFPRPAGTGG